VAAENPFVYGEVVPPAAFIDREPELARLTGDLAAGQKVFLISPRRYGKSSLVRQAMRQLGRRGLLTLELTVSSYSSYVAFLEGFARGLLAMERRADRLRSWLGTLFTGVPPEVRYEAPVAGGPPQVRVAFPGVRTARDAARLADEVFALPARIAEAKGRRVAIALDEFQDVAAFNGGSVEQALRAAVQHQREVGYVFAGSEPSLM
jgi:AAA+ ATPase superfamily predicted ATPase